MELFYHGTYKHCIDSIYKEGFRLSVSSEGAPEHWFGNGVYFFTKGITETPWEQARQWAKNKSWDNTLKQYNNFEISILKCEVEYSDEHSLDLTCSIGSNMLDYYMGLLLKKVSQVNADYRFEFKTEGYVINAMRDIYKLDIRVVKGHLYIKFNPEIMMSKWIRRSPNCTVCAVHDISLIKTTTNFKENETNERNDETS